MQTHPKLSLIEHFKDLADPRIDRTKEHDLIDVLIKSCSLVRSIRGSARSLKCSMRLSLGCVCIPFHLNTFSKSTSAKMAHPQLSFQRFLDASALKEIIEPVAMETIRNGPVAPGATGDLKTIRSHRSKVITGAKSRAGAKGGPVVAGN